MFKEGERVLHAYLGPGTVINDNDPLAVGGELLPCIRVQFDFPRANGTIRSHRYGKLFFDRYPFHLIRCP